MLCCLFTSRVNALPLTRANLEEGTIKSPRTNAAEYSSLSVSLSDTAKRQQSLDFQ